MACKTKFKSFLACTGVVLIVGIGLIGHSMAASDFVRKTDVEEYFPEIAGDLTKVTWAHAVNSQDKLADALEGSIMMLEADVVYGTLEGSEEKIPIMAHPPDTTSDLSLQHFIESVIDSHRRKGIKLDFKSTDVLPAALAVLKTYIMQIRFPVWLNADVLYGPVDSEKVPVDADDFLSRATEEFPSSTLSIGWTTHYGSDEKDNITSGNYSMDNVIDMRDMLKQHDITQQVTFPVRAGLAAWSEDALTWLLDNIGNSTLTVWSAKDDYVDAKKLSSVILNIGKDRVFVDVPEALEKELSPYLTSGGSSVHYVPLLILTLAIATFIFNAVH